MCVSVCGEKGTTNKHTHTVIFFLLPRRCLHQLPPPPGGNGHYYLPLGWLMRGPGESYSDVILRLVENEAGWRC